jgi:voltage-gated potassium channel
VKLLDRRLGEPSSRFDAERSRRTLDERVAETLTRRSRVVKAVTAVENGAMNQTSSPEDKRPGSAPVGRKSVLVTLDRWLNGEPTPGAARIVQGTVQSLILLNVAALVLESVHTLGTRYALVFRLIESVSVAVFALEYMARVASSVVQEPFRHPVLGRMRYMFTPLAIVDLLAIGPALLPLFGGVDLRSIRAVRLMRVFRLLKLGRYANALVGLRHALTSRREELAITGFAASILLILASSVLYLAEGDVQPDVFGSIPAAAWWGVETLTTVGYGDVAPVTVVGKIAASVVAVLGVGLFALPAGILGAALIEQVKEQKCCPHCGKEI